MKKITVFLAILALALMAAPDLGDCCTTYTSYLTVVGTHGPDFPINPTKLPSYGTVFVTLIDSTDATVTITPTSNSNWDFDFFLSSSTKPYTYSAFLNVNGSFTYTVSDNWQKDSSSETADGFGSFNASAYNSSCTGNLESITFTLKATGSTTWSAPNNVLVFNSTGPGFDAAVYVTDVDCTPAYYSGYVGEDPGSTAGGTVPVPPTVLLLGSGLVGLGVLGRWQLSK